MMKKKEGLLKYIIIRASEKTKQSQLCIVMHHVCKNTIKQIVNKARKTVSFEKYNYKY